MANLEQLTRLLQETASWNTWRWEQQKGLSLDLQGASLGHSSLRRVDLSGVSPNSSLLDSVDFHHADLEEADFQEAQMKHANLRFANLRHADLGGANIRFSDFGYANLYGAQLGGGIMSGAYFLGATLTRATSSSVNAEYVDMRLASLQQAHIRNSNFKHARLHFANLSQTDLTDADLQHALLPGADLRQAKLQNTNLSQADLSGADLTGADLRHAILVGAKLKGANMTSAQFGGTQLGVHDMRLIKGIETINHSETSPLDIQTLYLSQGKVPDSFIVGVGLPESFLPVVRQLASEYSQDPDAVFLIDDPLLRQLEAFLQQDSLDPTPDQVRYSQEIEQELTFALLDNQRRGIEQSESEMNAMELIISYARHHGYSLFPDDALEMAQHMSEELFGKR